MQTAPDNRLAVADFGKTRTRLTVLSPSAQVLAGAEMDSGNFQRDGLLDIDALTHWCEQALGDLYAQVPFAHLMPVTHGAAVVALRGGHALPVQDYEEDIDAFWSQRYDALRPPFAHTGSPSLPNGLNMGRQLYARANRDPDFAAADTLLTYPQYWVWRWCGARGTDVSSLGCHTDLWQPRHNTWSALARAQHWHRKFPPLVVAGDIAAPLSADMARRLHIRERIDVHWGAHDSNAALAAFLGAQEPFTLLSTGTWLVAFAIGGAATELDERRDTQWMVDVRGRPVACARFMAGREREHIAGDAPAADSAALTELLRGDALALPRFAPGGPFQHYAQPGNHFVGSVPDRVDGRAALASLYIALMTDLMLDLIGARGAIHVEGPLASDAAALTALAGLRPAQTVYTTEASCVLRGAARLTWGQHAVSTPPCRAIAAPRSLQPLLHARRRRWRQLLAEEIFP